MRGKLARQVREEQLEAALALEPDLSTVVAGLNDTLRRHCDLDVTAGHLDAMIGALQDTGATVVTMAFPDPVPVNALARVARSRVFAFNERLREIAARHGALVVDFERDGAPPDRRLVASRPPARQHRRPRVSPRRSPTRSVSRAPAATGHSRCRREAPCRVAGRWPTTSSGPACTWRPG